jgi:DNA-binding beta-propeller fold protein YncE
MASDSAFKLARSGGSSVSEPLGVVATATGTLWVADCGHGRILGLERDGTVFAVFADEFAAPSGLTLNPDDSALYVADRETSRLSRIDLHSGTVVHLASTELLDDQGPTGIGVDEDRGRLYVTCRADNQLCFLGLWSREIVVLAGSGTAALADGFGPSASFDGPVGLALSADRRRLYLSETGSSSVRVVNVDSGEVETLIGQAGEAGFVDGAHEEARLHAPQGVAISPAGILVADSGNGAIRGINPRHKRVTTVWSKPGTAAGLSKPCAVTFDRTDKTYVVADTGNDRLLRLARDVATAAEIVIGTPES